MRCGYWHEPPATSPALQGEGKGMSARLQANSNSSALPQFTAPSGLGGARLPRPLGSTAATHVGRLALVLNCWQQRVLQALWSWLAAGEPQPKLDASINLVSVPHR